jgi:epoxyqueuosine reductase
MQPFHSVENGHSQPFDVFALKARIVEAAEARGAGDVRVTPATPDASTQRRLSASFERGDLASWSYGEPYAQAASDPQHILAGARSIICIAVPYATRSPKRNPLHGRVSNYAWSEDYHRRLRALLYEIAAMIDEYASGHVTAVACDTKPIAERAFAARAGLGWVGKHTNLISPRLGSYVFLGEIITTIDLPPDAPLRKSCGSCARCVDACPTGALRGDYTIDATRCIADLTQRTDPIPHEWRPYIGDWIWGCDLCQDACPPTIRAGTKAGPSFEPLDDVTAAPNLVALLQLRSGEFKRRYARSAMGWRGAAVLRRNAAIALGNALDRSTVGPLAESLVADPHPMVRGACAWALGRIGSPRAIEALRARALHEDDTGVLAEINQALEPFAVGGPLRTT